MIGYESGLLGAIYANDTFSGLGNGTLHAKENLLGGTTLTDGNGNVFLETMPNVTGGETVTFTNGETGTLSENIYGGTTLDMPGIENDIVGRPSIFNGENFSQGGEHIGSIEPGFMENSIDFTGTSGGVDITASPDILGGTQFDVSSSFMDHSSSWQAYDLNQHFSDIDTISSHFSAADLGSVTDGIDALNFLDLF
ncbi:hypothetical protein [Rossellomorea vietnamensis]|uniref:hypothetical protein n=1 Tax=Rossellomorea vietnamensis TaxID=218284 RepID=UPI00077C4826|nr:hypothetical protein [Rossellomorea vietnamensis]